MELYRTLLPRARDSVLRPIFRDVDIALFQERAICRVELHVTAGSVAAAQNLPEEPFAPMELVAVVRPSIVGIAWFAHCQIGYAHTGISLPLKPDPRRQCVWFGPTSSSRRDRNSLRIGEVFDLL
jgi:hypothetical protein